MGLIVRLRASKKLENRARRVDPWNADKGFKMVSGLGFLGIWSTITKIVFRMPKLRAIGAISASHREADDS